MQYVNFQQACGRGCAIVEDAVMAVADNASNLPSPELLDDITARFILSSGDQNLESFERIMFLVEQAWWFYEDFVREKPQHQHLRSFTLKEFVGLLFERCPGLGPFKASLEEIYQNFNQYKRAVPVRGAILLDPTMEKCLLVRGWKKDAGWGFPRGKTSYAETDVECAIREVLEETGYDIRGKLREEDYLEVTLGDQDTKLYIVQGVDEGTHFAPHVRCEIGAYAWHLIEHLPSTWEEGKQVFVNEGGGRHKFYNVWPYIKPLQGWINRYKKQLNRPASTKPRKGAAQKQAGAQLVQQAQQAAPVLGQATAQQQPAAVQQPAGAGRSLLSFKFDKKEIMKHLVFPPA